MKVISREVKVTEMIALCLDTVTCEVCNRTYRTVLSNRDKDLKKVCAKLESDPNIEVVKVVSNSTRIKKFGMEIGKFLMNATEMKGNKFVEETAVDTEPSDGVEEVDDPNTGYEEETEKAEETDTETRGE